MRPCEPKAAQVALQALGVGSMEKVALAQLAQVVHPAERLVDPVQDFGILIKTMGHLALSVPKLATRSF